MQYYHELLSVLIEKYKNTVKETREFIAYQSNQADIGNNIFTSKFTCNIPYEIMRYEIIWIFHI